MIFCALRKRFWIQRCSGNQAHVDDSIRVNDMKTNEWKPQSRINEKKRNTQLVPTRGHTVRILEAKSHHRPRLHFRSSSVHAYAFAHSHATVYTCTRQKSTTVSGRIIVYSRASGLPRQEIANNDRINQGKKMWNTKGNQDPCHKNRKRKILFTNLSFFFSFFISFKFFSHFVETVTSGINDKVCSTNLISESFSPAYTKLSLVYWRSY